MANGNLKSFSGKVANVIGYQSYNRQRLRSMPRGMRQTLATKQSGRLFGMASRIGGVLRRHLAENIPYPSDIKMQTRLSSSIYKWLKESTTPVPLPADHLPFIEGYQFTEQGYTLAERIRLPLQITNAGDGLLQINMPAFVPSQSITAPRETVSVLCHFTAVNCLLDDPAKCGSASTVLTLNYNDQPVNAQTISLQLPTPAGSLLITAVSLKYLVAAGSGLQPSTAKGFMPAAIVSAMCL
ncbi:MAG: hypothetical protein Q8926_17890 [Bacteroidota bacterium]|nr:hypothetical protein [Bacteroidota bacterium]